MKGRVLKHNLWEHLDGDRIRGSFIDWNNLIFKGDTMLFNNWNGRDTLVFKHEYLKTMTVMDPKTGKKAKYSKKGASTVF